MKAVMLLVATVAMTANASLFLGQSTNIIPQQGNIIPQQGQITIPQTVSYFSGLLRGFITGYMQGMYKQTNYVVDPQCYGNETQTLIVSIINSTASFDLGNSIVSIQRVLLLATDYCYYDEALYQYLEYCYSSQDADGNSQCDITSMVQSLLNKVFQVTTVANDFFSLFMEGIPFPGATQAAAESFATRVGSDVGKLLRYATDFDPSKVTLQ